MVSPIKNKYAATANCVRSIHPTVIHLATSTPKATGRDCKPSALKRVVKNKFKMIIKEFK